MKLNIKKGQNNHFTFIKKSKKNCEKKDLVFSLSNEIDINCTYEDIYLCKKQCTKCSINQLETPQPKLIYPYSPKIITFLSKYSLPDGP